MYDNEYWREGPTTSTAALNEALSVCRLCRTFLQEGAWSEVDSLIHFPFQSEMPREVIAGTKAMMAQLIAEAEHSMEVSIWSTRMWDEALRREAQQLGRPMLTPSRAQAFVLAMDYVLPRWATEPMNVPEALNVVDTIYVVPVEMSRLAREASGQGALFFVLMGPEFGPGPPDPDLPMPRLVSLGAAERNSRIRGKTSYSARMASALSLMHDPRVEVRTTMGESIDETGSTLVEVRWYHYPAS